MIHFIYDGTIRKATPHDLATFCREFAAGDGPDIGDVSEAVGPAVDFSKLTPETAAQWAAKIEADGNLEDAAK